MDEKKEIILQVNDLKKYFPLDKNLFGKPARYLKAVDNISFTLEKGTTIGIVGESGCGKTTLGRTILKLYNSDGGSIFFAGQDITRLSKHQMRKYRTKMQLIFQDPYSSLPPRMTVGNIIGTNIFNICIVLGLPVLIFGSINSMAFNYIDLIAILIAAVMFYLLGRSERTISRLEGCLMLLLFVVYYGYLIIF